MSECEFSNSGEGLNKLDCFTDVRNDDICHAELASFSQNLLILWKMGPLGVVSASQTTPLIRHFVSPSHTIGEKEIICAKHDKNLSTYSLNVLETDNTPHPNPLPQGARGKWAAFTLAEVLITLGIIGVVAALTIPTIINKYQEQVTVTKLKKITNLIQNAERLSVIENGDTTAWETYTDFGLGANYAYAYFEKYYLPYINKTTYSIGNGRKNYIQKAANLSGETDKGHHNPADKYLDFADGSCLIFWGNNQFALMTYDVNCEKGPNIMGKDIWDIAEFYWYFYTEKNNGCSNGCHVAQITALNQPNLEQMFNDKCLNYNGQGGAPNLCFTYLVKDEYDFKKFKKRY